MTKTTRSLTFLASIGLLVGLFPASALAATPTCFGRDATIIGTSGSDDLTAFATSGSDVIVGFGGHDLIDGSDGNDFICGGPGFDDIFPGLGNDNVSGGPGGNAIYFTSAVSAVDVNLASGIATGGDGSDDFTEIDNVWGSPYNDTIRGSDTSNLMFGDTGDDLLVGGNEADWFLGQDGDDTLRGGEGFDIASFAYSANPVVVDLAAGTATGEGSDTLDDIQGVIGSAFGDTLGGGPGTNAFVGDPSGSTPSGYDYINGGGGFDVQLYIFSSGPINYYANSGGGTAPQRPTAGAAPTTAAPDPSAPGAYGGWTYGGEGTDSLGSMEIIVGTDFADIMTGDKKANGYFGGLGDDILNGKGKGDYLDGEGGADTTNGGGGQDKCIGETQVKCDAGATGGGLDQEADDASRAFRKH